MTQVDIDAEVEIGKFIMWEGEPDSMVLRRGDGEYNVYEKYGEYWFEYHNEDHDE